MEQKHILDYLNEGEIYLINDYENAVFRASYNKEGMMEVYTKLKGKPEFKANPQSGIFHDVFTIHYMITKEEYEKFS